MIESGRHESTHAQWTDVTSRSVAPDALYCICASLKPRRPETDALTLGERSHPLEDILNKDQRIRGRPAFPAAKATIDVMAPVGFREVVRGVAVSALESPYQQLKLMKFGDFEALLHKRDCGFGLHDWWKIGVLRPAVIDGPVDEDVASAGVFDVDSSGTHHRHFADGRRVPPSLAEIEDPGVADLEEQAWFHPFQLWQAYLLRRHLNSLAISPGILFGPEDRYMQIYAQKRADDQLAVERLLRSWDFVESFRLVGFAIAIAPLVVFRISGQITSDPFRGESYGEYWRWRSSHNPVDFLAKSNVDENDVRRWNEQLSYAAYGLDPLRGWFDLTRHVAWRSWQGIEGEALLAHDLYVMAELLRRYAEDFMRLELPEPDEVWHGPYVREIKRRQYGYPRAGERRREVRRRIAREFGLDGDVRLVWVVEGDTEEHFIAEYGKLTGITPDSLGMVVFNIKGDGNLGSLHVRQRLSEARNEDQFSYITVDGNYSLRPTLRALCNDSLITAGWTMWQGDFESDNFTDDELAALVQACATDDGVRITLDGSAITNLRGTEKSTEAAVNACLAGQHYKLQKDARWGRKLALWVLTNQCPSEIAEDGDRPIAKLFGYLLRACSAEFLGSVERYRVECDTGKIVAKEN